MMYSDDVELISTIPWPSKVQGKAKENEKKLINSYFMSRTTLGAQPTFKSVL